MINFTSVYIQCFLLSLFMYTLFQAPFQQLTQLALRYQQRPATSKGSNNEPQEMSLTNGNSHLKNGSSASAEVQA